MKYKDLKKKLKGASKENYSLIYEYMDFLERTKGNNRSCKGILHYGANKKLIPQEKIAMSNAFSGEAKRILGGIDDTN